jgi:hypothetical protein
MSVQISAYIQDDVKQKLEDYSSSHGMKKGFLIENAIEYYLQALHEIPSNIIVPSSITIAQDTYTQLKKGLH